MVERRRIVTFVRVGKLVDRVLPVVLWLIAIYWGVGIAWGVIAGTSSSGGSFGFGGLGIHYEVRTGGLLADRLEYAVITQAYPQRQEYWESEGAYTLAFAGQDVMTVRPKRGETVWVDEQGHVTSLGRVLNAEDIATLKNSTSAESPTLSSPEEFLATVARPRADKGGGEFGN
jgi:acyl-coenzyme A synthetase/AMP-(fatty) acid ligase